MGAEDASTSGAAAAPPQRQPRPIPWMKMSPIVWAPIMYTSRFWLKGRVEPRTQHAIFAGMVLVALVHGAQVILNDSSMAARRGR